MRLAYATPLKKVKPSSLAWAATAAAILVVILSGFITARGLLHTSNYRPLVSHESITLVITIIYGVLGAMIVSRQPRNPIGWIFLSVGILYSVTALSSAIITYEPVVSTAYSWAAWLNNWAWMPAVILPLTLVLLVFPDGHLLSAHWRPVIWSVISGLALLILGAALHPGPVSSWGLQANPFGVPNLSKVLDGAFTVGSILLAVGFTGCVAGFWVRYRRSNQLVKEQMKWLYYAMGVAVVMGVFSGIAPVIWTSSSFVMEISITLTNLTILGIAVAATIAILQHRLYDINLIINRTLVYTTLTIGLAALYGLVLGVVGILFRARGSVAAALVATGLAAVLLQPMRDWLQRLINRLMYGERDDPYAILSRLSRQLEASLSAEETLPVVVETIARALKLRYVSIALKQDGDFAVAASYGLTGDSTLAFPLVYQGETVGQLRLSARAPNETFTPAEQRMLGDIARHIGVTAHTVRLTQSLRQLAGDLQHSREHLVTAREEERRRLRRDLHDGLGPSLASQGLKLAALQQLGKRNPEAAGKLLNQLIDQNEGLVSEIRRLVYGLRPPALDQVGLVEAVRDQVRAASDELGIHLPLQIGVEEPQDSLPALPAAVEVAAYRVALEAVTNVYHHAQARLCTVKFSILDSSVGRSLILEVCDDGTGLPGEYKAGVGLNSMRERAEEVGGTCTVESIQGGGTRILASFPLPL